MKRPKDDPNFLAWWRGRYPEHLYPEFQRPIVITLAHVAWQAGREHGRGDTVCVPPSDVFDASGNPFQPEPSLQDHQPTYTQKLDGQLERRDPYQPTETELAHLGQRKEAHCRSCANTGIMFRGKRCVCLKGVGAGL